MPMYWLLTNTDEHQRLKALLTDLTPHWNMK